MNTKQLISVILAIVATGIGTRFLDTVLDNEPAILKAQLGGLQQSIEEIKDALADLPTQQDLRLIEEKLSSELKFRSLADSALREKIDGNTTTLKEHFKNPNHD